MGKRQENILKYINPAYNFTLISIPKLNDYKSSPFYKEIFSIYRGLGGIQDDIPVGIQPKDLDIVIDGKILELDEENHFNRYRKLTLKSGIYKINKSFDTQSYINYCAEFENNCQMRGGFWKSQSSERQFGISNIPGDFSGNGSARFKQRAFYDMLKDFIPHVCGIPIKRLSIYDEIPVNGQKVTVDKILNSYNKEYQAAFCSIIENYVRSGN